MSLFDDAVSGLYDNKLPYRSTSPNISTQKARQAYRAEEHRLTSLFMIDAKKYAIELGVPVRYAERVVAKAWEDGHAYGYAEVVVHIDALAELFKI